MEINQTQVKELYPGIFVKKKLVNLDQQHTYIFDLDVQDLNIIDFQADFQGSQNISIKGVGKQVFSILKTVEPRTSMTIAQVELHEGWKLKVKFRFLRRPIPKDKQLVYIKPENETIENEKKTVQILFKKKEVNLVPLEVLNAYLEKSKQKFVDVEFSPEEVSILGDGDKSLIDDTVNHWRRPSDFFDNKPHFLFKGINHKNIVMGKLLDYGFHSVVSCLTLKHESLIERLFFNQKTLSENGIYRLRLCKNGQWQTVTIDDYIPCEPLAKPKFASSHENQIWIHLLQKAYAKVHKRYLTLHELQISDVFNDLTGCPTIILNLETTQNLGSKIIENIQMNNIVVLYDIEEKEFEEDEFIPLRNYAYPITSYVEEKKKIIYTFLSHNHQMDEITQAQIKKKFKYACICQVQNWEQLRIKGKFVTVETGSEKESRPIVLSRWYYQLEIHEVSQIFIGIHQEDILIGNNYLYKKYKYLSVFVFQKGEKSKLIPLDFKRFAHNREFQMSLLLKPGIYLIVPIINSEIIPKKIPTQKDLIQDLFRKLDLLMRRQLKYADLEPFFKIVNQPFDQGIFNELLEKYTFERKGLGIEAFTKLWEKNELYWRDQAINHYEKEKLFTLSLHSKQEVNVLIKSNIGTELNNRAHCQMINRFGEQLEIGAVSQKYVTVKYLKATSEIIQYMAENKYERKVQITLDCKDSSEYSFIPSTGIVSYILDSGEKKYLMKLLPSEKSDHQQRKQVVKVKIFE